MMDDRDIVDVRGASELLRLHEETVRCMAREGRIPAFKVGRVWRFSRRSLHEWAQGQWKQEPLNSVLIVDDDEAVRNVARQVMERAGFRVLTAEGGTQALAIMRQDLPNVVLLDLRMPGMDGPTTLKAIRAEHGDVPVIIITGYPDSELVVRALDHGPVTLLAKPLDRRQLIASVQAACDGSSGHTTT
jgi:excisionase family DNA binding protein